MDPCGWSKADISATPQGTCIVGAQTIAAERKLGECFHHESSKPTASQISKTTATATRRFTDNDCKRILCGSNCAAPCGWSKQDKEVTRHGSCRLGAHTIDKEHTLGICSETMQRSTKRTTTNRRSTQAVKTKRRTTTHTVKIPTPTKHASSEPSQQQQKQCAKHHCGRDCVSPCGWSKTDTTGGSEGTCIYGLDSRIKTSASELTLGNCGDTKTATSAKPSTNTHTINAVLDQECREILCGAVCNFPCGWSRRDISGTRQGTCIYGPRAVTHNNERKLGECTTPPLPPFAEELAVDTTGASTESLSTGKPFGSENPTSAATPPPVVSTASSSANGGRGRDCVDRALSSNAVWTDPDGDTCNFYQQSKLACAHFGKLPGAEAMSAGTVCCVCGGGVKNQLVLLEPAQDLHAHDWSTTTDAPDFGTKPKWEPLEIPGHVCRTSNKNCAKLGWEVFPAQKVCGASMVEGHCNGAKSLSYDAATQTCRAVGARLCLADELHSGVTLDQCKDTPGQFFWTRRECSDNTALVTTVAPVGRYEYKCTTKSAAHAVRCCADARIEPECRAATVSIPERICNPCKQKKGWHTNPTSDCCYKHVLQKLSFNEAQQRCLQEGGSMLASVLDKKENLFITHTVRRGIKEVWLGGTVDANGQVLWLDSSGAKKYVNWFPNEPNGNSASDAESCLAAGSHTLEREYKTSRDKWSDSLCSIKRGFICKFCTSQHAPCTTTTTTSTSSSSSTITSSSTVSTTSSSTTTPTVKKKCSSFPCGRLCASAAPRCGWSSHLRVCKPGSETSVREYKTAGRCPRTSTSTTTTLWRPTNTCVATGCGSVAPSKPCQCDSRCTFYGDCCANFSPVCGSGQNTSPPS